jgi:dienelactone hydrolase
VLLGTALLGLTCASAAARLTPPAPSSETTAGDRSLSTYLEHETAALEEASLAGIDTLQDWKARRASFRRQLQEMLGLWPLPARTDLKPVISGRLERKAFTVENLSFQASPGLYCTANLYLPRGLSNAAPTVLYACGHWKLVTNGVSMGNKAVYQTDGAWFARNGYACLVLDTLLAGEIQGMHTGTRDHNLWQWNSRGYTPAGVEAWFGMRALDYLCTRPEVDSQRLGITGHSGGGAYTWTVTALDDRIKVAAPLAGMTGVGPHVRDNLIDRHCDCNFPINFQRWDFPQLAALAAPRPLLIGGTDRDELFPLRGTLRVHDKVARIYALHEATDHLGLAITPGSHETTPELRLAVLRWFNRHLKGRDQMSNTSMVLDAPRFFAPEELRVFNRLPSDSINGTIADTFVPEPMPQRRSARELRPLLRATVFAGWPAEAPPVAPDPSFSTAREGLQLSAWDFCSQHEVSLRLYVLENAGGSPPKHISLRVLDPTGWTNWVQVLGGPFAQALEMECTQVEEIIPGREPLAAWVEELSDGSRALAFMAPRGVGLTAWSGGSKRLTRIRRRFMLLGQTVDAMRVWDIRRSVHALQAIPRFASSTVDLRAARATGVNTLYAALFEPGVDGVHLAGLPESQVSGPDYLGILKVTDLPEILHAASSHTRISLEP